MTTIKFSHRYSKLLGRNYEPINEARLLDVVPIDMENMSEEFLAYDTDQGKFALPEKGQFLMLIFLKPGDKDVFTTLRRANTEKKAYYRSMIGRYFNVQIIGEGAP